MKGADIGLISLYHGRIYDLHSVDFVIPKMDKIQNWELLYLETTDDGKYTVAQFQRRLLACDEEDFSIETDRLRHNVMIAYNGNDPLLPSTTNSELNIIRHQNQQRKEVNLFFDEPLFLPQTADDEPFADFVFENLIVSKDGGNTQYWCSSFILTEKRYLTGLFFWFGQTLHKSTSL